MWYLIIDAFIVLLAFGYQIPFSKRLIDRMIRWSINLLSVLFTPKLLFTFGIGWMVTNGWAYIGVYIGTRFHIPWLLRISGAYLTILWIPGTPEKIITVAIAIFLAKIMFPKDIELQEKLNKLKF